MWYYLSQFSAYFVVFMHFQKVLNRIRLLIERRFIAEEITVLEFRSMDEFMEFVEFMEKRN